MRKILTLLALGLASAAGAQQAADAIAPEAATSGVFDAISPAVAAALEAKAAGTPVEATEWMVAAANPWAVQAGADVGRGLPRIHRRREAMRVGAAEPGQHAARPGVVDRYQQEA